MTALGDQEDAPPLQPGKRYDEKATTLRPPPEKVAEINAALVEHEKERVAEWLGKLDAKLASIDAGVKAALAASERAEIAAQRTRADVHLWLFGDGQRAGIAQDLGVAREGVASALAAVTKHGATADKALKVAEETYNAVMHGPAAEEGKRGSGAPGLEIVSGSGRPPG